MTPLPAAAGPRRPDLIIAARRLLAAPGGGAGRPRILAPGYVAVAGGAVAEVGGGAPPAEPDVDLRTGTLLPGFVDLQVNGYYGEELSAASPAGWQKVAAGLPETGVTSFLPTFITAPRRELAASLRRAARLLPGLSGGARVLGVHLEGPFISPAWPGAHRREWIAEPDPDAVEELLEAGAGCLRLVTLAPERDGALAAVARFARAGLVVSVGHSDATARQVAMAADAGARMVTHLFNAQRPLRHRDPGVPGQALADPRLTSGLIGDLRHVDALVCRIAFAAAPGRICLVTDAAPCAGLPPGRYRLGGGRVELPPGDGAPPVRDDGALAGSALRMDVGVANMVRAGVGLVDAVEAASRAPADLIGRPDLGRIEPGCPADLTWLDDDLRAKATWVAGRQAHPARRIGRPARGPR